MTAKEQLIEFVENLPEEKSEVALLLLEYMSEEYKAGRTDWDELCNLSGEELALRIGLSWPGLQKVIP